MVTKFNSPKKSMVLSNGVDLGPQIQFCMHGDDTGGWPIYEGWNGGRWNGWLDPMVTKETYQSILAWNLKELENTPELQKDDYWMESINEMKAAKPLIDGLYSVGWGLCWDIV